MRIKKKSRVIDLLKKWNKELKVQNALGTGGSNYNVIWGTNITGREKFIIESGSDSEKGGITTVIALHEYHAVAIIGGFREDVGGIECLPVKWSKSRGWEKEINDHTGAPPRSVIVPVTIEELQEM